MGSWSREDIQRLLLKNASDGEAGKLSLSATAFIYVAPCERLIGQAFGICHELEYAKLFRRLIRVDDRLSVSCCQPGMEYGRLVSLLHYLGKMQGSLSYKYIDQMWLEQRIHGIEGEERQFGSSSDPANEFGHCFDVESYSSWEIVAAIVNVGEEAQIREIMASESFPQHPHVPSATEIYAMHCDDTGDFTRRFLGKYRRNPHLVKRRDLELEVLAEDARPRPESASGLVMPGGTEPSPKRQKVSGEGSVQGQEAGKLPDESEAPGPSTTSVSSADEPVL
jgi:hypothetical protein